MHGSAPAFRHDWQWPALRQTFAGVATQKLDAWWWIGFGDPNIAAQLHPFFAFPNTAGDLLGSFPILAGLFSIVWGASAWGMVALLRDRFGAADAGAFAGAFLYAFAPLVVVKVVAGHLPYLTAYAALPFVIWSSMGSDRKAAIVLAASLCVAGLQLQLFAVAFALMVLFRRLRWAYMAGAAALALCTIAPYLWSLLRPGAAVVTRELMTTRPWELNLSAPLLEAAGGLGYFEPYWQASYPSEIPFAWLFALLYPLGVAGALLSARYPFRWYLAAIYVVGVLLVAGLHGPLGLPLEAAFNVLPAASAFRELYDLAILIVFACACGFAETLSRIPVRAAWTVTAGVVLLAVTPWVDRGVLSQTGTTAPSPQLQSFLDRRDATAPLTRFLIVPTINPVGRRDESWSGVDSLALPYRSLMPLWIYMPKGLDPAYLWLAAGDAATVDRSLGISAIIRRGGYETKHLDHQPQVVLGPGFSADSLIPSHVSGKQIDGQYSLYETRAPLPILQLVPARFSAVLPRSVWFESEHGSNPRLTFAPILDYWYLSSKLAHGAPSGVVTFARRAGVRPRCDVSTMSADIGVLGTGSIDGRNIDAGSWMPLHVICGRLLQVAAKPMIALTPLRDLANWDETRRLLLARRIPLRHLERSDDKLVASAGPCRRCSLVLAERFDPGWILLGSNDHDIAASDVGGFNEWNVDLTAGEQLRVFYRPALALAVAVDLSIAAWLAISVALGFLAIGNISQRKSATREVTRPA